MITFPFPSSSMGRGSHPLPQLQLGGRGILGLTESRRYGRLLLGFTLVLGCLWLLGRLGSGRLLLRGLLALALRDGRLLRGLVRLQDLIDPERSEELLLVG